MKNDKRKLANLLEEFELAYSIGQHTVEHLNSRRLLKETDRRITWHFDEDGWFLRLEVEE
jgi:hypothetical protein